MYTNTNLINSIFFLFIKKTKIKIIFYFIFFHFKLYLILIYKIKKKLIKFEKKLSNFIFKSEDWFLFKTPLLISYFDKNYKIKNKIVNILEIGSYEGRSAIFFSNFFKKPRIVCVDPFIDELYENLGEAYRNFLRNVKYFNNIKIEKIIAKKFFIKNKNYYDLIYIDGSHKFKDVYDDLINAYKFVKINKYILLDDVLWRKDYLHKTPLDAINLFIKNYSKKILIIYCHEQMLIKKIS